jgi:hypothetical protein
LIKYEDGILTVSMSPPVAIGGWEIQFKTTKRFGGTTNLFTKSVASGFNGQSGITITNSGAGIFNIQVNSVDSSGLDFGNYAAVSERLNSGSRTTLTEGFLLLMP